MWFRKKSKKVEEELPKTCTDMDNCEFCYKEREIEIKCSKCNNMYCKDCYNFFHYICPSYE